MKLQKPKKASKRVKNYKYGRLRVGTRPTPGKEVKRREEPRDWSLTVDLLRRGVGEEEAHHLLEVAAGLGGVAVLAHRLQHPLQHVVQRGRRLVQQDAGPRQEAVQVAVGSHLLLKVGQLHVLREQEQQEEEERWESRERRRRTR